MGLFYFVAIDADGLKQKGTLEADNAKHARELLRQKRKLTPLEVLPVETKKSLSLFSLFFKRQRLSTKELALLTRQLATLMTAGLPLKEVLTTVAEQTDKQTTKSLLFSIRHRVASGHTLESALRQHPQAFSALYSATVASGEQSGHLDKILLSLADYVEKQAHTRQKITHALIYPSIMTIVAISIVGFLLTHVIPNLISIYASTEQALPLMTQVLISFSHGLTVSGIYILIIGVMLCFFFLNTYKKSFSFRQKTHRVLLRLPMLGPAIKMVQTARFLRTFSLLFSAGIPVIEAMTISSHLVTQIPIREAIDDATQKVKEGSHIHLALKQTLYFPPMSIHLIASGETSGQLGAMLERAALNQENDTAQLIETGLTLFEPALILVMGAIVLFIVLAVLLPIFQMDALA